MKKKWSAVLSMLLVFAFVLTACGSSNSAQDGVLYTALQAEPGSLDPGLAQSSPESWVINHLYTGLLAYDKDGKLVEGMSTMPEVSPDGLTYTFHIKDGMKWSNGEPVTANDFQYEWLRVLNPETAAVYAYQLYYLKGGEAYNSVEKPGVYYVKDDNGNDTKEVDHEVKYTDADLQGIDTNGKTPEQINDLVYQKWLKEKRDQVGVKALDDKTLQVVLENPTPYFADLTAFYSYYPVNQKVAEQDPDWAKQTGDKYVCNGPFTLKDWQHNSQIQLVKNDHWYDAKDVKLNGITIDILEDANTGWQNFDSGKYGVFVDPPKEIVAQKLEEKAPTLKIGKLIGTYYYNFNNIQTKDNKNPFANKDIRKALSLAIDRDALVNNITKGGEIAATGMVPGGLKDDQDKDFRDANGKLLEYNPEKAKELLAKGLQEEGLTKADLNGKVILYNTDQNHKKIAQAIQEMWKNTLGIDLQLENVDFNVKMAREHAHDFDISRGGWVGDYSDPMTILDLFVTGGPMDDCGFSNKQYDELIKKAKTTGDQKVRMDSMKEAEKILMEEAPIAPIYFYTQPYFVQEGVKGIYKPALQYPVLTYTDLGAQK